MLVPIGKKREGNTTASDFQNTIGQKDDTITTFDKSSVEQLRNEINKRLENLPFGVVARIGRVTYTAKQVRTKLEINIHVDEDCAEDVCPGLTITMLRAGKAPYGTPVYRQGKPAIILKARRKKYLFKYTNSPKEWVASFETFTLRTMEDKVANKSF